LRKKREREEKYLEGVHQPREKESTTSLTPICSLGRVPYPSMTDGGGTSGGGERGRKRRRVPLGQGGGSISFEGGCGGHTSPLTIGGEKEEGGKGLDNIKKLVQKRGDRDLRNGGDTRGRRKGEKDHFIPKKKTSPFSTKEEKKEECSSSLSRRKVPVRGGKKMEGGLRERDILTRRGWGGRGTITRKKSPPSFSPQEGEENCKAGGKGRLLLLIIAVE